MSFMAGIISPHRPLEKQKKIQFHHAFAAMEGELSCPADIIESSRSVLVQASFPHMWQGGKSKSGKEYDAVASGVQWREIPHFKSTLDYLISELTSDGSKIPDYFDRFSCILLQKKENRVIGATDPLGLSALLYLLDKPFLVFSSHQTFFKHFLGNALNINWQAVFEYLIIGHYIGNKTLHKNVKAIPPGCKLLYHHNKSRIVKYAPGFDIPTDEGMPLHEAVNLVYGHLARKCDNYSALTTKPFAGFLSGGWDSRLLISLFANIQNMATTFTSQQKVQFHTRLISEKKIASEVARFIRIPNHFVAPTYRDIKTRARRGRIVDHSTWFHDWAFALADKLPYDRYVFCDGLLGDILLRGLFVTPELRQYTVKKDRNKAVNSFHSQYVRGFNPYTRGVKNWKSVIQPHLMDDFSVTLKEHISEEIYQIQDEDFVTMFLLRNRSRRGISPLPRFILGMKGAIVFPFSDYAFLQKALSLSLRLRLDHRLYNALLERSRPGLSMIPSTNTKDFTKLQPYLIDSISELTWGGQFIRKIKSCFPPIHNALSGARAMVSGTSDMKWGQELVENPPQVLMDILRPELRNAINMAHTSELRPLRFFLDRVLLLECYFS
jgi:hypothetical protein